MLVDAVYSSPRVLVKYPNKKSVTGYLFKEIKNYTESLSTDAKVTGAYMEWFKFKVRSIRHGGRLEPMPRRTT